jgi:hypothetical protein
MPGFACTKWTEERGPYVADSMLVNPQSLIITLPQAQGNQFQTPNQLHLGRAVYRRKWGANGAQIRKEQVLELLPEH